MNANLAEAKRLRDLCLKVFRDTVADIQAACPHEEIVRTDGHVSTWLANSPPVFACASCGAWEYGGPYSDHIRGFVSSADCRRVSEEEIYALREGPNRYQEPGE